MEYSNLLTTQNGLIAFAICSILIILYLSFGTTTTKTTSSKKSSNDDNLELIQKAVDNLND